MLKKTISNMQSIRPSHIESLCDLISENVDDRFGKAVYLDHEVIIMKSNGYVNMTKICKQYGKELFNWKKSQHAKELILEVNTYLPNGINPILEVLDGDNQTRGTYVHKELAPHIAAWISPRIAIIISRIINNYQVQQYKNSIAEKDDNIKQLLNKVEKLEQQNNEIIKVNKEMNAKLDDMNDKLDIATDDYVPSAQDRKKSEWFVLLQNSNNRNEFYTIRRQSISLNKWLQKKIDQGFIEIERFQNPNAVNILHRLKELKNPDIEVIHNKIVTSSNISDSFLRAIIKDIEQQKKDLLAN